MSPSEEGAPPPGWAPLAPSLLPPLYAEWLAPWLSGPIPEEKKATCSRCAMCAPEGGSRGRFEAYYSPITKCCTYVPELANFLVGRIVSDDEPDAREGRATVDRRIDGRVGVTPFGLSRSRLYSLIYSHNHDAFGSAEALQCPHHLPDGRCGVWRHRESTCATWFCKHERGATGKHFWRRLHDLLSAAEVALARHAVLELGLSRAAVSVLVPPRGASNTGPRAEHLDGEVDGAWYGKIWGDYLGREREFYLRTAEIVSALCWNDVLRIGGAELRMLADLTLGAHDTVLSEALPERPHHTNLHILHSSRDKARVATYSNVDPLDVPRRLLDVLHRFDGRPTAETLAAIEAEDGLKLAPGLVRKLVDFEVLADEG